MSFPVTIDAANSRSYVISSTTWNDLTYNLNVGTLTNGTTYSTSNGGVLSFDGVDDYVYFSNSGQFTPPNISIEVWLKPNNTASPYNQNFLRLESGILPALLMAFQDGGNTLGFGMATSNDGYGELDVTINGSDYNGKWKHIMATYTSGAKKLYVNGTLVGQDLTLTGTLVPNNSNPMSIGSWILNTSESFNGDIAITRIYNKALSSTEVLQNYNAIKGRFGL